MKDKVADYYIKKKTPFPNKEREELVILQVHSIASIIKRNEDFLGKGNYIHINHENADVLIFPVARLTEVCIMIKRPCDIDSLANSILDFLNQNLKEVLGSYDK